MDEASRLVSELHRKLAELDQKVWQYRRDMATEFTKYKEHVLRDVPKEISDTVSEAIAGDMKNYKSLDPSTTIPDATESPQTGTSTKIANSPENAASSYFTSTTNTKYHHGSDGEVESPRSPHEREVEFQGVFTPSYLPLLDSTSRNERRSSYEQYSPSSNKGKGREMESPGVDASSIETRSLAPSAEFPRPPTPKRRNTDEVSVISATSDDNPVRRSALRRSSSSKAQSPRRVRFDFAGSEVLPNASPLPHQSILGTDIPSSPRGLLDDSDDETGSEQVEDIDSRPPKRISSSQALRALSRRPLEDDSTVWTTVSAPPDGSASVETGGRGQDRDSDEDQQISQQPAVPVDIPEPSPIQSAYTQPPQTGETKDDTEVTSDEEILDMSPSKRAQKSASATILSPIHVPGNAEHTTPTSATRSPNRPWLTLESFDSKEEAQEAKEMNFEDDYDEIFHFGDPVDDHRSPPEVEDEDYESDSPLSPALEHAESFARSPPRAIPARDVHKPTPAPLKGVVGSYKGKSFSMPIVSDELHAQAATLGAMNSFVGSVNGRSGMDESDVQSFRESLRVTGSYKAGFSATGYESFSGGAPKSMTERMMMEDLMEAEENAKKV